jgi:hypothetical protein
MPEGIKYAKDFQIPNEFPEILRNLTREILRDKPKDINKYAAEYFDKMIQERSLAKATSDETY